MKCVKCGAELTAAVCGGCGFDHQNKDIVFLSKPAEGDLQLSALYTVERVSADEVNILDQYEHAQADFRAGNYDGAVRWLQTPALEGHVESQVLLATILEMEGKYHDPDMSLFWFRQAAELGNPQAIDRMIWYYQTNIPVDPIEKGLFAQALAQWRAKKEAITSARRQIRTYSQYLRALEAYYLSCFPDGKKKKPLTTSQIEEFMRTHELKESWNLSPKAIEMDLQSIYTKHSSEAPAPAPAPAKKKPVSDDGITSYREYIHALTKLYLDGGKKPLSDMKLRAFLRKHDLERRLGVQLADVKIDLQNIVRKHQ